MTGLHLGHMYCRGNGDENGYYLDSEMVTLPRLFKNAGYATGAYGKWGLTRSSVTPCENCIIRSGITLVVIEKPK